MPQLLKYASTILLKWNNLQNSVICWHALVLQLLQKACYQNYYKMSFHKVSDRLFSEYGERSIPPLSLCSLLYRS